MNIEFMFTVIKGIGLAIGIGLAFLIVPFGMLVLVNMFPWALVKIPLVRQVFIKKPKGTPNNFRQNQQVYIDYCHPSQVIKRLKSDGLQSLFFNYSLTKTPVHKPDAFCNKDTPTEFFNSANPKPINYESQNRIKGSIHDGNLS